MLWGKKILEWTPNPQIALSYLIDLNDRSNQPFQSNDLRYTIVFNGEIYNYNELKKRLILKGYRFNSNGDTEVFAFLLGMNGGEGYDGKTRRYVFYRDFGIMKKKPCF